MWSFMTCLKITFHIYILSINTILIFVIFIVYLYQRNNQKTHLCAAHYEIKISVKIGAPGGTAVRPRHSNIRTGTNATDAERDTNL